MVFEVSWKLRWKLWYNGTTKFFFFRCLVQSCLEKGTCGWGKEPKETIQLINSFDPQYFELTGCLKNGRCNTNHMLSLYNWNTIENKRNNIQYKVKEEKTNHDHKEIQSLKGIMQSTKSFSMNTPSQMPLPLYKSI